MGSNLEKPEGGRTRLQRAVEKQPEYIADQMEVIFQNFANGTITREQARVMALQKFEEILDSSLTTIEGQK